MEEEQGNSSRMVWRYGNILKLGTKEEEKKESTSLKTKQNKKVIQDILFLSKFLAFKISKLDLSGKHWTHYHNPSILEG